MIRLACAIVVLMAIAVAARAQTGYTFTTFAGQAGGSGIDDGTGSGARFNQPTAIATDSAGNMYVADYTNHTVRKLTPTGIVTTLAGRAGFAGTADGTGSSARFRQPAGVAVDSLGNVYVSDYGNHTVRKITPAGVVTTFAGLAGTPGSADGAGGAARFNLPRNLAVDDGNNILVADSSNHTIRKITPAGVVTTFAGLGGSSGSADGTGSVARFKFPGSIAIDASGNIYVGDGGNCTIRRLTAAGDVTTLAGLVGVPGTADGTGSAARFKSPFGIATDTAGNILVADALSYQIRAVTPAGVVTTLAGLADAPGSVDATGTAARFGSPTGVTTSISGDLYVTDYGNHTIRKVTPAGAVTTLAGLPGGLGTTDGNADVARFHNPYSIALDPATGDFYVGETFTIRKISGGVVSTLAGTPGTFGSTDGAGNVAQFRYVTAMVIDSNQNVIYAADTLNQTIRKITMAGVVSTFAGLAQTPGNTDGSGNAARFNGPTGLAIDGSGNLYVADRSGHTIRMITPAGAVSTLAGLGGFPGTDDGTGSAARFYSPNKIAIDSFGNLYVSDEFGQKIRMVTPGGVVTTVAGASFQPGSADGNASAARFSYPSAVATDSAGNVYVADNGSATIRKIDSGSNVTTIGGSPGVFGDAAGTGADARFAAVHGMVVDGSGSIYIADTNNNKIKVGRPALSDTANINSPTGIVGQMRLLFASPTNGGAWQWTLTRQPGTSTAEILDPQNPTAFFTPDVAGVYTFRLTAGTGLSTSITTVTLTVGPLPTSTQLATTPNPSEYGQSITLTATVTSGGTPTNNVVFYDGTLFIGTTALNAAGQAQLSLSTLGTGSHELTASYGGDGHFQASNSNQVVQTVNRATSAVGFNSSLNPSTQGDAVTFSANVDKPAATGTVTFWDGTTVLGTNPLTATPPRTATLTTSSLSPGLHSITVTYDGDTNFNPATSGVLTQSVYALFGAPPGLVASATSINSVTINWVIVAGADHYELVQTSGAATPVVTTPVVNTATVSGLTPGTTYLYQVRAVSSTGTASAYSIIDPATTIIFTDEPIVAGVTTARAVHIMELRQGVNAMRASVNLAPATFPDAVVSGSIIKAVHLNELRSALTAARTAMFLSSSYTDVPIAAPATVLKAVHVREIRDAMK